MKTVTSQRKAIVTVLMSTTSHPTAEWVYDEVRKEMPGVGLATVYRTLRLLAAKGMIQELNTREGKSRFDGNIKAHYHFLCDRCGSIIDLDEQVDSAVEARVAQDTGLMVTRHSMELSGLCLDCQSASPAGADLVSASALHR